MPIVRSLCDRPSDILQLVFSVYFPGLIENKYRKWDGEKKDIEVVHTRMCSVAGVKILTKSATEKKIQFGNTTYIRINV